MVTTRDLCIQCNEEKILGWDKWIYNPFATHEALCSRACLIAFLKITAYEHEQEIEGGYCSVHDCYKKICRKESHIPESVLTPVKLDDTISISRFKDLNFDSQLFTLLTLLGLKTRDDLIRYIACDGEPADESCIGHPVLVEDSIMCVWEDAILEELEDGFYLASLTAGAERGGTYLWEFAKKKPGYDYTQKIKKIEV